MEWKLAEAKNKFSEVFTRARGDEPQFISRRGEVVVVITKEEYQRLKGETPGLIDYIMNGPDISQLDLTRIPGTMRDVDL